MNIKNLEAAKPLPRPAPWATHRDWFDTFLDYFTMALALAVMVWFVWVLT